jgi:hypothetical protein
MQVNPAPVAADTERRPTLAVFASDKGPGDPERASIMSQAGAYFARRGARIACFADRGGICIPLVTSARAAGGEVLIIADGDFRLPPALAGLGLEILPGRDEALKRVATLCDAYVGLPGSLASIHALYSAWVAGGSGLTRKPVLFLNRHGAFEVLRGYSADILSHRMRDLDKVVQFSDSIEDLWSRVSRLV